MTAIQLILCLELVAIVVLLTVHVVQYMRQGASMGSAFKSVLFLIVFGFVTLFRAFTQPKALITCLRFPEQLGYHRFRSLS